MTYTVVEGNTDRTAGNTPISIILTDSFGNTNSAFTSLTETNALVVDATKPTLTITMASDNDDTTMATTGDDIVLTLTASESVTALVCTIDGEATTMGGSATSWTSTLEVSGDETEQATVFSCASHQDAAGNTGVTDTSLSSGSAVTVDLTAPLVGITNVAGDGYVNNAEKNTNGFTITGTALGANTETVTCEYGSASITTTVSGTAWTCTFTTSNLGNAGTSSGDSVLVAANVNDAAGNAATEATFFATEDTTAPSVTALSLAAATLGVGDTVTLTITADAVGYSKSAITVNGVNTGGLTDAGGGSYTTVYTVAEGNTDRAAGATPASVVVSDAAGNTNSAYTTITYAGTLTIDANTPVISSATIAGGTAKVGTAITLTVVADAAGYTLSAITLNAVAVTGFSDEGSGNYEMTYTVVEGNTDRAAGATPVSVVLSDG
jgi:hypothetical protein